MSVKVVKVAMLNNKWPRVSASSCSIEPAEEGS
jgi:hypothetical protein